MCRVAAGMSLAIVGRTPRVVLSIIPAEPNCVATLRKGDVQYDNESGYVSGLGIKVTVDMK